LGNEIWCVIYIRITIFLMIVGMLLKVNSKTFGSRLKVVA
jgi:hypothetical protein